MSGSVSTSLGAMIKSLNATGAMLEKCMPDLALAVMGDIERTIAAGTTPYGEKWKLTLKGAVPLRNAAKAVRVSAVGKAIFIVIEGIEAKHHLGAVRGKIKRRVIPSKKKIPDGMLLAMKQVLDRYFESEVKHAA